MGFAIFIKDLLVCLFGKVLEAFLLHTATYHPYYYVFKL